MQPSTSHIIRPRRRYPPDRYHRIWPGVPSESPGLRPDLPYWVKTADLRRLAEVKNLAVNRAAVALSPRNPRRTSNDEQFASDLQCMGSHNVVVLRAACESSADSSHWLLVLVTTETPSRTARQPQSRISLDVINQAGSLKTYTPLRYSLDMEKFVQSE